ncbi:DUF2889 domain-containing protein [Ramlibacter henchirensis]|uniref:DUF2889 domain-containing protein n=1 Tax=Ramlibacter henchirensis TaxID=204072 RepID=A0A4Z0BLV4_9BURK|nr:DUF2889 domain-containing protein [Ramlibacter henchirensis]TFY99393.1 DUF2889 domain-containing protein [Ramlibacter henchirensis]
MPLPEPAARRHLHTRSVTYHGFLREDGLWDIEGELADVKTYSFDRSDGREMPPGSPIHHMRIRLTVDEDMVIRAIAVSMDSTPFGECQQGKDPMQQMVGVRLGPGWRQAIEKALGGVRGCTHLRELLFNMATAAYQTVFPWRERERREAGIGPQHNTEPPYHLGRCIAWDTTGAVTLRYYPQFFGRPLRRPAKDRPA